MKEILLNAIVCPQCHGKLQFDATHQQLICQTDKLIYPIIDGIPVLLTSEATSFPADNQYVTASVIETDTAINNNNQTENEGQYDDK